MYRNLHSYVAVAVAFGTAAVALAQTATPPARSADNLIVAAYNIQFVGNKPHDFEKLAQVIQHFDICGVIEVKSEYALAQLEQELENKTNKPWGSLYGIRTHRPRGTYHEAYGVLWRRDRAEVTGLVSNVWDLEEAFRNDPFMVSFKRENFDFMMMLVHTRWSDDNDGTRAKEVDMFAEQVNWMWEFIPERDVFIAGDFNYPGTNQHMKDMAEKAGLKQLDKDPKSTFKSNGSAYASSYDHIYAVDGESDVEWTGVCDTLDVTKLVFGDNASENMRRARTELSDHLPVFAVFKVDGVDDD